MPSPPWWVNDGKTVRLGVLIPVELYSSLWRQAGNKNPPPPTLLIHAVQFHWPGLLSPTQNAQNVKTKINLPLSVSSHHGVIDYSWGGGASSNHPLRQAVIDKGAQAVATHPSPTLGQYFISKNNLRGLPPNPVPQRCAFCCVILIEMSVEPKYLFF